MEKLKIYCLDLFNEDLEKIKKLKYEPVGLGQNNFNKEWIRDNSGKNISQKNKYFNINILIFKHVINFKNKIVFFK